MLETRLRTYSDQTGGGAGTSFAVPLVTGSGGTGRTTIGSAHTILGVNSSEASLTYYAILASNNATVTKVGTSIFISAVSAAPITYAATGNNYAVLNLAADLTSEYRLVQSGNSITIDTTGNLIVINASTGGGGSGPVNTGSANYLAYYPTAGTTVDDVSISVSTGGGIAPFNVAILTAGAASIASGDFWFQSSNNVMYLAVRSSNVSYYVAMAT